MHVFLVYIVALNIELTLNLTMVEVCNLQTYITYFMVIELFHYSLRWY
jgi:hypothetical protein